MTCDDVRDLAAGFVLDALEPDEMAAVREHLATCADPHAEIAELASAVPVLAASVPVVEPPAALGARIRAAAAADLADRGAPVASAPAVVAPAVATLAPVVPLPTGDDREQRAAARRRPGAGTWLMGIAAVLAIALLGGWNLQLQGQLSSAQAYEDAVADVLDVAAQPGSMTALLTADGGGPTGLAAVDGSGALTMAMQALAPTSGEEVYEAWVIAADGVPVPLGSFQVDASGTGTLASSDLPTEPGIVLALTREPGPGATSPTLPIVASGEAAPTSAG
jgi:anti-sigma-K factor RskA